MTETNTKETKIVKATPKKTESQEDAQPRVTVKAAVIPQTRNHGAARPARPQAQASERPAARPPMGRPVRLFLKICSKPKNLITEALTEGCRRMPPLYGPIAELN